MHDAPHGHPKLRSIHNLEIVADKPQQAILWVRVVYVLVCAGVRVCQSGNFGQFCSINVSFCILVIWSVLKVDQDNYAICVHILNLASSMCENRLRPRRPTHGPTVSCTMGLIERLLAGGAPFHLDPATHT